MVAKKRFSEKKTFLPLKNVNTLPSHDDLGVFALEVNIILQAMPPKLRGKVGRCSNEAK